MPPKQKGQNIRGRDKIFRHAVEHVHIGVGHAVLGNLSLQLAAGPPPSSSSRHQQHETVAAMLDTTTITTSHDVAVTLQQKQQQAAALLADTPAFYLELNAQLLSHSSKDFKKLRWEVLELCETRPLFLHHQVEIAGKLLDCLLERSGGSFSNKSKAASDDTTNRGETSEGFEAFVRLTIAFVRDLQAEFLPFYEAFQEAIQAGLFDRNGNLIADVNRLQLVYSVQAAWCRELVAYWVPSSLSSSSSSEVEIRNQKLVRRILAVYVRQLHDTKEYIRRLAAEWLAYLCRLCRPMVSLVCELASGDVLAGFEAQSLAEVKAVIAEQQEEDVDETQTGEERNAEKHNKSDGKNDDDGEEEDEEASDSAALAAAVAQDVWAAPRVQTFIARELATHPVVDGLGFFAAELFRGMRGSLSTSFERFYVALLEGFLLLDEPAKLTLRQQQQKTSGALLQDLMSEGEEEEEDEEEDGSGTKTKKSAGLKSRLHGGRWAAVFAGADAEERQEENGQEGEEAQTCQSAEAHATACLIVREVGGMAIRSALAAVLGETRKHSARGNAVFKHRTSDDDDDDDDDDSEEGDESEDEDEKESALDDGMRPSHRLLQVVVVCLQPQSAQHIRLLAALLNASSYFLWSDRRELALFKDIVAKLRTLVTSVEEHRKQHDKESAEDFLACAGALLEMLYPLCATPFLVEGAGDVKAETWLMELQKLFLPTVKECVAIVARLGYASDKNNNGTAAAAAAARLVLFAFAQDVLQKNFAFCLAEERRIGERHANLYGGDSDSNSDDEDAFDKGNPRRTAGGGGKRSASGRRNTRNSCGNEDHEDAYVDEEQLAARHSKRATSSGLSSSSSTARKAPAVVVPSFLTPLALTLLHSVCHSSWSAANACLLQNKDKNRTNEAATAHSGKTLVDEAILLARLTLDRTRHVRSSPLQQLLRLVSQKAKQSQQRNTEKKGAAQTASAAGEELVKVLEGLLRQLVELAEAATSTTTKTTMSVVSWTSGFSRRALDWLTAALPLLGTFVTSSSSSASSSDDGGATAMVLKTGLLSILRNIKVATTSGSGTTTATTMVASSTSYSLYATISVLLINLASGPQTRTVGKKALKAKAKKGGEAAPSSDTADAAAAVVALQRESLQHVSETIAVLARGFAEHQQTNNSNTDTEKNDNNSSALTSVLPSEDSRTRLFHGAELLLDSLLSVIGVDGTSLEESTDIPNKKSTVAAAKKEGNSDASAVLRALMTLQDSLSVETQRQLVEGILFESLTAPSQPLRVLALRLLRLLCHVDYPAEKRFTATAPLDVSLFDALLAAEQFNPLSQTGNLDGVRQALAKIAFAAEAGTITDPLERVLLARAMIGLLYMKFADAWPVALKILSGLVRRERTSMLASGKKATHDELGNEEEQQRGEDVHQTHASQKTLTPLVWDSVVCRYAHLLVFGDVLGKEIADVISINDGHSHDTKTGTDAAAIDEDNNEEEDDPQEEAEPVAATLRYYRVHFTDFQRHQRGELVSKTFSLAQYIGSGGGGSDARGSTGGFALVNVAEEEDEVIAWATHSSRLLSPVEGGNGTSSFLKGSGRSASTDRSTLAKTFLSALEEMMKSSSSIDRKLRLVEDIVLELVAIQRNEHPGVSTAAGTSRRLDDRLALAMRACSAAPTTVLSAQDRRRLSAPMLEIVVCRNRALAEVFLAYTSDTNGKLQRAALDNLRRLKVEPYNSHHAQLTPYCDNNKALFNFLNAFHVETDIPAHEQVDYIATALAVALPKLIATVSKEKRKDQAVLRRRMMGFLTHLSDRLAKEGAAEAGVAQVLDQLVQRLVFCRVTTAGQRSNISSSNFSAAETATMREGVSRSMRLRPEDFAFLTQWESWVGGRGSSHCVRRLERLCRQLLSTVQLLDSLLHAVGTRFASYVPSCLHLVLQSYLLACKQVLKDSVDKVLSSNGNGGRTEEETEVFSRHIQRAFSAGNLSSLLAQLRRASLSVVAQLFEQFPEDIMSAMEESTTLLYVGGRDSNNKNNKNDDDDMQSSLFGQYLIALFHNSRGVTHDVKSLATGGVSSGGAGQNGSHSSSSSSSPRNAVAVAIANRSNKSYVTPVLRLLTAWSHSTALLPLFTLFPSVVVGTFSEIFAVSGGGRGDGKGMEEQGSSTAMAGVMGGGAGPAHRASAMALREGLGCLNELLAMREEAIPISYLRLNNESTSTVKKSKVAKKKKMTTSSNSNGDETATFGKAFLAEHVVPIFTALYRLLVRGADEDSATAVSTRPVKQQQQGEDVVGEETSAADETSVSKANTRQPQQQKKTISNKARAGKAPSSSRSIMSFKVSLWKDIMQTTSLLSSYITESGDVAEAEAGKTTNETDMGIMLSRLSEVALHVVTHPACVADNTTALVALEVVDKLLREVPTDQFDTQRHLCPLVHLTNVITLPESRRRLCGTLKYVLANKARVLEPETRYGSVVVEKEEANEEGRNSTIEAAFAAQLVGVGRAVCCLNSFNNDNEDLTRYDFELRYHAFHSLIHFFNNKGNYGALAAAASSSSSTGGAGGASSAGKKGRGGEAIRKEREYNGEQDVRIPLDHKLAPLLCVEGFYTLAATVTFLLRDPENTVRALAIQLVNAMLRYATTVTVRSSSSSSNSYAQLILEEVVRKELLPSLRRGVVAKDVNIRTDHMIVFGSLGRYYAAAFPSFAKLYSPNTEQNFFLNVGHVQPKCRLHALALLRRDAAALNVRDLLRVFIPFLMSAVKDFAQGKRDLRNLTESKAKGYCDAVLMTIAAVTQNLPWEAYHRVLTLFLANASANASLRMPMLRGVVQVLNNFSFLDAEVEREEEEGKQQQKQQQKQLLSKSAAAGGEGEGEADDDAEDEEEAAAALVGGDADDAEAALVNAAVRARRRQFRHMRITHVLEQDILPQLFEFIGDGDKSKKALGLLTSGAEFKGNQHSITAIRRAQQKEDKAASNTKNAILQLPVAIAITKIVKKFPEERFNFYVDHILDEVVLKLRTKNDKHRDSARRILGALLRETGPSKLRFVLTKLKDNLVHGYQLHVLGYTVVTLLYQLYEPQHALLHDEDANRRDNSGNKRGEKKMKGGSAAAGGEEGEDNEATADPVLDAVREAKRRHELKRKRNKGSDSDDDDDDNNDEKKQKALCKTNAVVDPNDMRTAAERKEDDEVEAAEEELLAQLVPHYSKKGVQFDYAYGVRCLMDILDDLMRVFLDDYLGEVGMQKEQIELMSTIVEVKRNRALQGFSFLARHCEAATVMDVFLQRITWVLTPPSDATVDVSQLHGSERARALLMRELRSKYLTVSKNAGADLVFVNKVRLLATRIARGLMTNPSMQIDTAFAQVRDLLDRHNAVREAKIKAFEARDGTRRIRGNAHVVIHKAQHDSWKGQLDKNYLVDPVPERVDVDFSSRTVLATQQKQKLRVYKGRYGKEVQEAARDFYREDPTTAVVLDTLDEFLMKFLLSVLKRVLGIGKEKKYTAAAVRLDLLRKRRQQQQPEQPMDEGGEGEVAEDEVKDAEEGGEEDGEKSEKEGEGSSDEEEEEDEEESDLDPQELDDDDEDDLDAFAAAQQDEEENGGSANGQADDEAVDSDLTGPLLKRNKRAKLSISFTTEYRTLLESLVPSVLATLQGEGSDPVIANALDCLLALVSLRPPLSTVHELNANLFNTVTSFLGRGGSIKQRAMRVCAAVIAHQPFKLASDQASQLARLVRAEIMDRSPFLPMALSLFYSVLGKHSHVTEVYDMIDIVTELMVHLSSKPVIVRRCILIFVRFLTEFKLTAEKFRSHIDLLCKNLDYPEVTGRLALLDCLETLVSRLPVVVLRQEAPVLLVPLAATITSCEWKSCRERAGRVLQAIARFAGIDVLVPILSSWLFGTTTTRPQRTMAMQVWATSLPALTKAYHLPEVTSRGRSRANTQDTDASEEEQDAFQASCEWSLSGVLEGCLYDQYTAVGVKLEKTGADFTLAGVSKKDRATAEMKGWTLVFYSLRCAEAMVVAMPNTFYPILAPRLVPAIVDRLMTHTHPWVQAAALRILRHYCYTCLEQHCLYLQEPIAPSLTLLLSAHNSTNAHNESGPEGGDGEEEEKDDVLAQLPFLLPRIKAANPAAAASQSHKNARLQQLKQRWLPAAERTLDAVAALLKALLTRVGLSDVANEQQKANRTLEEDQSRTEGLKLMVYAAKALSHVATTLLVASAVVLPSARQQLQVRIQSQYASLFRHIHALVKPVLDQRAVTNYVVRTATLVQFFGGFISVLPQLAEDQEEAEEEESLTPFVHAATRWLLQDGMQLLSFTQQTIRPLLSLAFIAGRHPQQRQLLNYTHQSAAAVRQQLEERRALFVSAEEEEGNGEEADDSGDDGKQSAKQRRLGKASCATRARPTRAATTTAVGPSLDTVLTALTASLAHAREEKREKKITADTKRNLKRNKYEMEKEQRHRGRPQQQEQQKRGAGGSAKMAIKKKFGHKKGRS